jgi:site-specific DNA-methyltransferase (adenine-specific)
VLDYPSQVIGQSRIVHADCLEWLEQPPEASLHAVVTDPPYGIEEYEIAELEKRGAGRGGIWRIPPVFDGHTHAPRPRFTALNAKERDRLHEFFLICPPGLFSLCPHNLTTQQKNAPKSWIPARIRVVMLPVRGLANSTCEQTA